MGSLCPNFYGANDFYDAVVAGKTTFQDQRFVSAISKLKELTPYMPDLYMGVSYTDMQSAFINEMAAHFIGGSFEAGYFASQNPKLDFDVFPGPTAKKGDPHYVSVYADGNFSMNAASKQKEAAAKLLRFLQAKRRAISLSEIFSRSPQSPMLTRAYRRISQRSFRSINTARPISFS